MHQLNRRSFLSALSRLVLLAAALAPAAMVVSAACAGPAGWELAGHSPSPAEPAPEASGTAADAFPQSVTDFQGRQVRVAAVPQRIVSIGPSNTEFLFALGAGERVVGVDDFSSEPAAARSRERVGGVKVSLEKVTALRPDLVVTVKFSDGTIDRLAAVAPAVLVVDPQGLEDVSRTAVLLGAATGAAGQALADEVSGKLASIRRTAAGLTPKPRVFHEVDATDPSKPFTVGPGSFVHELIELAGGENVAARAASPYPQLSVEELVRADPEVIVLADADYGVTAEAVATRPGWRGIAAVAARRIHPVSADLVSRPGPRVAEAAEAYAKLLHPSAFR